MAKDVRKMTEKDWLRVQAGANRGDASAIRDLRTAVEQLFGPTTYTESRRTRPKSARGTPYSNTTKEQWLAKQQRFVDEVVRSEVFAPGPYTVSITGKKSIPRNSIFDQYDRPLLIAYIVTAFPLFRTRAPAEVLALVERALNIEPEVVLVNANDQHAVAAKTFLEGYGARVSIVRTTAKASGGRKTVPQAVRREVWRRDRGVCVDCGSRENLEYDHVIPMSRGGANTARNIALRCAPCNRHKAATI